MEEEVELVEINWGIEIGIVKGGWAGDGSSDPRLLEYLFRKDILHNEYECAC